MATSETTTSTERKGLRLEDVLPTFRLVSLPGGALGYQRLHGDYALVRDWSVLLAALSTVDRIGPFGDARRAMAAAERGEGARRTKILLESDDGQYSLFVPANLLRPLFSTRLKLTDEKSRKRARASEALRPADPAAGVEMELAVGRSGEKEPRPSLSQLRRLYGGQFATYGPLFAGADRGALMRPAAGRPDVDFVR